MPYPSNLDLPPGVRRLPAHAQDIFRAAFNNAWSRYAGSVEHEERAHRIAWAAVKRRYMKVGDEWVERSDAGPRHGVECWS
jgi:cation transport regulator